MNRKTSAHPVIPILAVPVAGDPDDGNQLVSMYQKQPDIYPRAVKGWFATWRWTFVWLTQLLFYGLPWLQWGGRQAVLFDLEAQRFYIFGLVLYPQDLIFLAALLVLSALALVLLHRRGRPAVVRLHLPADRLHRDLHVGRAQDRRRPHRPHAAGPGAMAAETRSLARAPSRLAWLAIALFTGFSFVGYFTPIRELAGGDDLDVSAMERLLGTVLRRCHLRQCGLPA